MKLSRKLTGAEYEEFIGANRHGILAFGGRNPYAIPMGYMYRNGDILLGFLTKPAGRKLRCLHRSRQVCFTICRPRWSTGDLKDPCTTVIVEGTLEEVPDRTKYGLPGEVPDSLRKRGLKLMVIKAKRLGARQCTRKPCELFEDKKGTLKAKR